MGDFRNKKKTGLVALPEILKLESKAPSTPIRFVWKQSFFFLPLGLPSTHIRWKLSAKTCLFKNALPVFQNAGVLFSCGLSLQANSPGRSGGAAGAGKGRRACNYVSRINLNICIEKYINKVDTKCWLAEMTLVLKSLPLSRAFQWLFTLALVSASRWQLSRRGVTGELEVEFKFQRRSYKLSFLSPAC